MPDNQGMVRGSELRVWGLLGRPPEGLTKAHPELIRQWKKLAEEARQVIRLRSGPTKNRKAKDIEHRRAQLVRDIETNVRLLGASQSS